MALYCKSCDSEIPAADINIAALMAKCSKCNAVFSFADEQGKARQRPTLDMPKGITVNETNRGLELKYRWFSAAAVGLLFFAIFWNGFMLVWFGIAISQKQWMMAAFGTLHGAVGAAIAYFVLASFLNTTTIRANSNVLQVEHGPLPWPGRLSLKSAMITQIFCKQRVHHNKNGSSITYEVHANSSHGKSKKLLSGFNSAEQALFIEQTLERYLEIEDEPVPGDYSL